MDRRSGRSTRYIRCNGDMYVVSNRLIRHVWKALTENPKRTYRSIAAAYGLRSTTSVALAVAILRAAGKISDMCYHPRTIKEPFTEERGAAFIDNDAPQQEYSADAMASWFIGV